jgi:hypothetical protein
MTYRFASIFVMLFSPRTVSAACVYASIYALGVLFTYRLASFFQMLFSPRNLSAGCIFASIYALGVLFANKISIIPCVCGRIYSVFCMQVAFRVPSYQFGFIARATPFDCIPRPHSYVHTFKFFL